MAAQRTPRHQKERRRRCYRQAGRCAAPSRRKMEARLALRPLMPLACAWRQPDSTEVPAWSSHIGTRSLQRRGVTSRSAWQREQGHQQRETVPAPRDAAYNAMGPTTAHRQLESHAFRCRQVLSGFSRGGAIERRQPDPTVAVRIRWAGGSRSVIDDSAANAGVQRSNARSGGRPGQSASKSTGRRRRGATR